MKEKKEHPQISQITQIYSEMFVVPLLRRDLCLEKPLCPGGNDGCR